jgi:hypothetical protein
LLHLHGIPNPTAEQADDADGTNGHTNGSPHVASQQQHLPPVQQVQQEQTYGSSNNTTPIESPKHWQDADGDGHDIRNGSTPILSDRLSGLKQFSTIVPFLSHPTPPSHPLGITFLSGIKVSLLGMEVDGSEFNESSTDEHSVKSHQDVLALAKMYRNKQLDLSSITLPSTKAEATMLANHYFGAIHPFAPVVDKRAVGALVSTEFQ